MCAVAALQRISPEAVGIARVTHGMCWTGDALDETKNLEVLQAHRRTLKNLELPPLSHNLKVINKELSE